MKKHMRLMVVFFLLSGFFQILYSTNQHQSLRYPLAENYENSLISGWSTKIVEDSLLINDMENLDGWTTHSKIPLSLTNERFVNGKYSLKIQENVVDTAFFADAVRRNGTFGGDCNRKMVACLNFSEPQDWSAFNRISMWIYIPVEWKGIKDYFRLIFDCADIESHPVLTPLAWNQMLALKAGQWNQVYWEISELPRHKVTRFYINYSVVGDAWGKEGTFSVNIDKLQLEKVNVDKNEGWLTIKDKISYCHTGYTPEQQKIAITSNQGVNSFKVVNNRGVTVLEKEVTNFKTKRGDYVLMDFSELRTEGNYAIVFKDIKTKLFPVSENVWRSPIEKALNFFYHQRCGFHVPGVHDVCHQDWQGVYNSEKRVINGGWHDAGDLCQGAHQTGLSIYAMLELLKQLDQRNNDPKLFSLVLDETIWGVKWWLKTRFSEGNRIQWSTIRVYTDNKTGTNDDIITKARNVPWMNFLSSGIEAYAYELLHKKDPLIAEKCIIAAKEDWNAAMVSLPPDWDSKKNYSYFFNRGIEPLRLLSWGAIASVRLYQLTKDQKYAKAAVDFGHILMQCQETTFKEGIPITGYFYNTPEKNSIVHYTHNTFEESPILALTSLCEGLPNHPDWIAWYGSVVTYSDYFMKKGAEYSSPYKMLSAAIYSLEELDRSGAYDEFGFKSGNGIEPDMKELFKKQIAEGEPLSENFFLRRFPVQVNPQRHGSTALQLSQSTALALGYKLRNDSEGEKLVAKQMEWILGNNPFSQSLMYGEGYDYCPLFSASSGNIVGALPVGMDCMANDEPHWYSRNHMTTKEVWVVPTSRFIWSMAYVGTPSLLKGRIESRSRNNITILNKRTQMTEIIQPNNDGFFSTIVQPGEYCIKTGDISRDIVLLNGCNYTLNLNTEHYFTSELSVDSNSNEKNIVGIKLELKGKGKHKYKVLLNNCTSSVTEQSIELISNNSNVIEWKISVTNPSKPWIAVVIPNDDINQKIEVTGVLPQNK